MKASKLFYFQISIWSVLLVLVSCNSQLPDYSKMKQMTVREANAQLYQIRDDIKSETDEFSVATKLNLVMTDFIFQHPEEYEKLKKLPVGFDKKHLLTDANFVAMCSKRSLDTSEIEKHIYLNKSVN